MRWLLLLQLAWCKLSRVPNVPNGIPPRVPFGGGPVRSLTSIQEAMAASALMGLRCHGSQNTIFFRGRKPCARTKVSATVNFETKLSRAAGAYCYRHNARLAEALMAQQPR